MKALVPIWPCAVLLHWVACAMRQQPGRTDLLVLRGLLALATTANVICSDGYHNVDQRAKPSLAREIAWVRWDFVGISAVLSGQFALWTCHFNYAPPLDVMARASAASTVLTTAAAFLLFERDREGPTCHLDPSGASVIKPRDGPLTLAARGAILALMAVQFFGLFGRMVYVALGTSCAPHTVIWWLYLPGVLAYAVDRPKDGPAYGAHDIFHGFVIAGHVASCACDWANIGWDCAAA